MQAVGLAGPSYQEGDVAGGVDQRRRECQPDGVHLGHGVGYDQPIGDCQRRGAGEE